MRIDYSAAVGSRANVAFPPLPVIRFVPVWKIFNAFIERCGG